MRFLPALAAVAVVAIALSLYAAWHLNQIESVPIGLSRANGRIEATRVSVATKYAGRVAEILVKEGDFVAAGTIIARMDAAELLAEIAVAKAQARQAEQTVGRSKAEVLMRQADLKLAIVDLERAKTLQKRDFIAASTVDQRQAERDVAAAAVTAAEAGVGDSAAAQEAAEAAVVRLQAVLSDQTLTAPVSGRVEYKLAQPGEVLGAGGQIVTLLDLSDVYMTIFLPNPLAGRVGLGSEARIVLDAAPDYVVPATVSFVAAEAQFTP